MGSSSSKKSQPPAKKTAPPKPVANVNKQQNNNFLNQNENGRENDVKQTPQFEKNTKRRDDSEYVNTEDKGKDKVNKKMKMEQKSKSKENMLTFEDESDMENDIDEVLKMPMAIEYPKQKKKGKKEKKNKGEEQVMNYDRKLDRDLFNSNDNNGYSQSEDLPETYAQRLQRQQYKLQQDLLIRQKTMHRNSKEWDDCGDDEDENFMNKGFDASKFRAANKGTDGKKELFKTSGPSEELDTPRYLQTDQAMDDFTVNRQPPSPKRDLPSYNQSELDLMQDLERDLL